MFDWLGGCEVGIDDCEVVSCELLVLFDVEDLVFGYYVLEVLFLGIDCLLFMVE